MSLNLTGNNLIPYPYYDSSPKIVNGITFTVNNDDGSVTANGTSTATANFLCLSLSSLSLKKGEYILSSGLIGDNTSITYGITFGYKYENRNRTSVATKNGSVSIVLTENAMCDVVITVRANQTLENLTFKPMLNKGTTALPYEPYKSINPENIKVNMSSNLIPYPYAQTTLTTNGITFTDNGDGTITANGTATADTPFKCQAFVDVDNILPSGNYFVSGCPQNGSTKTYCIDFAFRYNNISFVNVYDIGAGVLINAPNGIEKIYAVIRIKSGITVENLTFYPMLNKGTTALPYEKYIAPKDVEKVVVAKSPNLINFKDKTTQTINGITFTVNEDGSVTVNGTATADAYLWSFGSATLSAGAYTASGCPEGGARYAYAFVGTNWVPMDVGNGDTFTVDEYSTKQLAIYIRKGITVENLTFYPMLNKGTTALPYQKYDREVVWSKTSTSDETTDEETTV